MSSILTNNSAMVALSTLRNINNNLSEVQSNISTGKKIANSKDNAAIWSVSAVMKSDVTGFKAINDSLALGSATLNVARNGAETVNKLMDELKGRIVAAQADNVDRAKIQADADSLRSSIDATVEASQFNGLNMLKGEAGNDTVNVIGSLDRDSNGNVTVSNIEVARTSLELGTVGAQTTVTATQVDVPALTATGLTVGAGSTYSVGDKIALSVVGTESDEGLILSYTVTEDDLTRTNTQLGEYVLVSFTNQARTAANALNGTALATNLNASVAADVTAANGANGLGEAVARAISGNAAATNAATNITVATGAFTFASTLAGRTALGTGFTIQGAQGGGLSELGLIDVSTKGGAKAALTTIEGMTQTSIDSAAAFGSTGKRVDIQMEFLKGLTDGLNSGIGALVDADMEEASARLQALQVQQQLGIQALSIANQQPQTLLSLFR